MSFPPGTEMFQFPGFALVPLFNSGSKSLLLISANPKIARSAAQRPTAKPNRAEPEPASVPRQAVSSRLSSE